MVLYLSLSQNSFMLNFPSSNYTSGPLQKRPTVVGKYPGKALEATLQYYQPLRQSTNGIYALLTSSKDRVQLPIWQDNWKQSHMQPSRPLDCNCTCTCTECGCTYWVTLRVFQLRNTTTSTMTDWLAEWLLVNSLDSLIIVTTAQLECGCCLKYVTCCSTVNTCTPSGTFKIKFWFQILW